MFSQEPRCIYPKNPLSDVICQLRFPEILSIGENLPAAFQEAIRADYPLYASRKEAPPPKLIGSPGNVRLEKSPATVNYQFTSEDGVWRINLTSQFLSLACNRYTRWETFAQRLDKPLAAFIQLYKPAFFDRIGLRYLNFISRQELGMEGTPFRDLFTPCWLGPLADPEVAETAAGRCGVDLELAVRQGCRVKVHAGPGFVKRNSQRDPEMKFIFDQDLFFQGKVPLNLSASVLESLHSQAWSIFRGAITDDLHEAFFQAK